MITKMDVLKAAQTAPASRANSPKAPKQEPSIASKAIEAGLEIGENLAEGLGSLFILVPGYAPEQEAMNNEMERRHKKTKRNGCNNRPGDIIIVSDFVTGSGHAQDKTEILALCHFNFERGILHGFALLLLPNFVVKHLAVELPVVSPSPKKSPSPTPSSTV